MNDLKQVKDKDDVALIKNAIEGLSEELQKIGASLYNKDKGAEGEKTEEKKEN